MREEDIRPRALFDAFLRIVEEDTKEFFPTSRDFEAVPCVACGEDVPKELFVKAGFRYVDCDVCRTIYASPRPRSEAIATFYAQSRAVRFWAERFYRETEAVRQEKIFRPRAQDVAHWAKRLVPGRGAFVDIGSGYGTFLDEVRRTGAFDTVEGIEPSHALAAAARAKGLRVMESTLEDVAGADRFDVASSFELLEHLHGPLPFLQNVFRLLRPGGMLYLTTLNGRGFDLLLLGERSKSLSPPHHLNFLHPGSLELLFRRAGFELLEASTPGQLDVDIVLNMGRDNPLPDGFTRWLLWNTSEKVHEDFQDFLRRHRLSSHMRAVARKPKR